MTKQVKRIAGEYLRRQISGALTSEKIISVLESQGYKGKEKKALQERIDALHNEKNELEKEIEPQERTRNREINEKINALKDQGKDQRMELATIRNRIAEIDRELTMDR